MLCRHHAMCSLSSVNLSRASPHQELTLLHRLHNRRTTSDTKAANNPKIRKETQTKPPDATGNGRDFFFLDPVSDRRTPVLSPPMVLSSTGSSTHAAAAK
uniref:Uncharacterized protein n=1 Tax=Aegilops tauschii subsp. strangulata TaxID=200361 RepID=A0A453NIH2_AEGTS